jgi:hypothetical protein
MDNNIILNEIKINGNTNFITDSGLESGSQIFAIGDSHSIFFHNSMKIKEHWVFGVNIPLTIYTLLRDKINIYEIGNTLGKGHEKYNIKSGDYVIFYYGFNDIQKNIKLHSDKNWENEIYNLFTNYVNYINELSQKYNIKPIIPCIYPNPRPNAEGQNSCGSYEERRQYVIYANKILENNCKNYNIPFLNIYDNITDEKGFIKENISNDNIHLDYNNINIRTFVENEILKFCF